MFLLYSNELLFSVKLMGFSMKYQINDLSKKIVIDILLRSFCIKVAVHAPFFYQHDINKSDNSIFIVLSLMRFIRLKFK